MPDTVVETPQTVSSESSTETSTEGLIASLTPDQYQQWRLDGTLPEAPKPDVEQTLESETPPSNEASTPPTPAVEETDGQAASADKAESGSAPDQPPRKERKGESSRIKELLAQVKAKDAELAALRAKAEEAAKPPDVKTESSTVKPQAAAEPTRAKPRLDAVKPDGQPVYTTYEEYVEDLADWKAEQRSEAIRAAIRAERDAELKAERDAAEAKTKAERDEAIEKVNKTIAAEWSKRVAKARQKYADFDEVALDPNLPIKAGTVPDAFILDSTIGTDVVYYLATHRSELDRINELNPVQQARELTKIELSLSAPPKPRTTQMPKPPLEIAGTRTAPVDEIGAALKEGDFERFKRLRNAEELAKRKAV